MTSFNHVLYWLLANSMGGKNRVKIIEELFRKPQNANELSKNLSIEYKTIRYHLKIMMENNLIEVAGSGYGKTYFVSDNLKNHKDYYKKILKEIGKI
jgi:predicted transcriptional regulator